MPRAPRRRRIIKRVAASSVADIVQRPSTPDIQPLESSHFTKEIAKVQLPRRRTRHSAAQTVVADVEEAQQVEAQQIDEVSQADTQGKEAGKVADPASANSTSAPPLSSTPRAESDPRSELLGNISSIRSSRRLSSANKVRTSLVEVEKKTANDIFSTTTTGHNIEEEDLDNDNRSTPSSESSDIFGFSKIRGIRIVREQSMSPSEPSSPATSNNTSRGQALDDTLLSSPLSELRGPTPSPSRVYMTDDDDKQISSPLAVTDINSPLKQRRASRKPKGMQVTTAQLSALLPRRPAGRERTRTRSFGAASDDADRDEFESDDDEITNRGAKQAKNKRSSKGPRREIGKENLKAATKLKKRTESKQASHLAIDINHADDSDIDDNDDGEQEDGSDALRERENEQLRAKFKEVDQWDLEVESVVVDSDSSFL
ncbi:uncharacterized protein V2V93DRAFT_375389 [Kockiozyma suomiensis]|uniref:uncharacterized protein n=1 Tax=Kockiozyma suomiensis TaxID=1337062 RepID=UPI0033439880